MNDSEFDVLDELYFLQPFRYLRETLDMEEVQIRQTLWKLLTKKWVKCFAEGSEVALNVEQTEFDKNYQEYHYLASKEGLLAHNSR